MKILIVEDEEALRTAYTIVLSSDGHKVVTAGNGSKGLAALQSEQPDLVLLDVSMPVMNGIEMLKQISKDVFRKTSILMFSNTTEKEVINEALRLGAKDFLFKSALKPKELLEKIKAFA